MEGHGDRGEVDQLVKRVLAAFDLAGCQRDARWRGQLKDLRRILAADYRRAVRTSHRGGVLPVRSLARDAVREFPDFNVRPIRFDTAARAKVTELGITLRLQPHARQRLLRGFYHRDARVGPIIWVNLAHPAGAVAASLGHELGHWYRERLLGSPADDTSIPFFNTDFAAHLGRPAELFADVFPVLAAYPTAAAERIFSGGRRRPADRRASWAQDGTLARLRTFLSAHYDLDVDVHEQPDVKIPRRIYYVTSMLHFARLRLAVLQETGI